MNWPVTCEICGKVLDSQDSYAGSKEMLRAHLVTTHTGENKR